MKGLFPVADGIVAVSQRRRRRLIEALVPNANLSQSYDDLQPRRPTPEIVEQSQTPAEHEWFTQGSAPVILSVGRLTTVKDHATLLRAFALVFLKRRVRLVILGDGPERETLLELAERLQLSEHVYLPGFKVNPFTYMSKAGVFVLSSRYEGFPNVLVQAMACGTPVVSTDCRSGPTEILEDGKWGRMVPVGRLASSWQRQYSRPWTTRFHPTKSSPEHRFTPQDASIDRYLEVLTGSRRSD